MKKLLMFALLSAMAISVSAQQSGIMYIAAKNGLSLRERPGAESKQLEKIPYGTKITIIQTEEESKKEITEGMAGYWQKIKYNNKTGYILDSYLFPWPPPKVTVKELKNYITQV